MPLEPKGRPLPLPADPAMAERNMERWREQGSDCPSDAAPLLSALFGNSPFLALCLLQEPDFFRQILNDGPDETLAALTLELRAKAKEAPDAAALMRELRLAKRRLSLMVAIADITDVWPLEKVTAALSDFAELALGLSARRLLQDGHERGDIVLPHPDDPERDSGLVVLGMGKLGARELNYSSDIDLVILYDDDKVDYRGRRSVQEFFVKLARELSRLMEERTVEGYVFRTDLRLRPDPGSTPPAISIRAAEIYYEAFGQNWERAAMIKARQVAGDESAGAAFLAMLKPFIWRKHLDFAAIQDIHSIKRQINAHKGGGRIAIYGHNIKLGRGGIREIEFFAQTQQLIWGGREPDMRASGTLAALAQLAKAGHIKNSAAEELEEAYRFLRRLEHRLQMIDDQQTQTLPNEPEKLARIAIFLGFEGAETFAAALGERLRRVEHHYAHLFEDAPPLAPLGDLVFTGAEDDPGTLKTLTEMGFGNAPAVCASVRGWHHGRVRATRSARAREMLTELVPSLLRALAATAEPDTAFLNFTAFLDGLPAGVPLFALFTANPGLLELVAEIMGSAPRLAQALSARPNLLDRVLSRDFFDPPPDIEALRRDLDVALAEAADDVQEWLDAARRWANEQKFRIGVQILRNLLSPAQAGRHLTDIAECCLGTVHDFIARDFARQHGAVGGLGAAIVAMGKMGSGEMTASSDLDLILVYDAPADIEQSDGAKPLVPVVYYARLTQRIINALFAKTAEGALYEVDMRLRPSGNAGPIATSLDSFARYHESSSWTWEHMALTRARVITGRPELRAAIETIIRRTLTAPRDPHKLVKDVADMRQRIWREHGTKNPWEVKQREGGMIDIEFIAQYLQLGHASTHPEILDRSTRPALLNALRLGLLDAADGETLIETFVLWSAVQQALRQTVGGTFDEGAAPLPIKALLAKTAGQPDFEALRALMEERAHAVRATYQRLIDEPAAALSARTEKGEHP